MISLNLIPVFALMEVKLLLFDSSIKDGIETRMLSPNPTKATENRFSEFDDDK